MAFSFISTDTARDNVRAYHKKRSIVFLKKISDYIKAASERGENFVKVEESFTMEEDRKKLSQLFVSLIREEGYKAMVTPSQQKYCDKVVYDYSIGWEI